MNGDGTFTYNDGRVYKGVFMNNLRHGKGVIEWPNGKKYDGMWLNGKEDGLGVYTNKVGQSRKGLWYILGTVQFCTTIKNQVLSGL